MSKLREYCSKKCKKKQCTKKCKSRDKKLLKKIETT